MVSIVYSDINLINYSLLLFLLPILPSICLICLTLFNYTVTQVQRYLYNYLDNY